MTSLSNSNELKDQLKKFIVDNNIIATAAGVSIAIVTKDVIQSFVGDIVIPCIFFLLLSLNLKIFSKILPGKTNINFTNFVKQFITWLLVIIITFLFVNNAFKFLLGVEDTDKAMAKQSDSKKESFFSGNY